MNEVHCRRVNTSTCIACRCAGYMRAIKRGLATLMHYLLLTSVRCSLNGRAFPCTELISESAEPVSELWPSREVSRDGRLAWWVHTPALWRGAVISCFCLSYNSLNLIIIARSLKFLIASPSIALKSTLYCVGDRVLTEWSVVRL